MEKYVWHTENKQAHGSQRVEFKNVVVRINIQF